MENKKISFGFSKISKKTEIISKAPKPLKQVDLIDCLEGQSIKIKNAIQQKNTPLVIPIQGSPNKLLDEIKKTKDKRIKTEIKEEESKPDSELTIDELAARELIREARNRDSEKIETKVYSLPLVEEKFVPEGAVEPSLDDYQNVPISDYGMAMLRGMNWKEGMPIGKRTKLTEIPKIPELRPKGSGLGANKMVNTIKPGQNLDKNGKELLLMKGAFGKIIAGNQRGHYCEIQGLDDENCRVIVRTVRTNEVLSLNEFLIIPVGKEEFEKNSRVINNAKYEEYKEKAHKNEESRRRSQSRDRSEEQSNSRRRSLSRERSRSRSSSEGRKKKNKKKSKKSKHRYSSDSEDNRRKHKKKNKSRNRSSDSESDHASRRKEKDRKK